MKKRLLLLFLCALLSFSLIACEKEEISVIGEFYTEDGLVKNLSFQIALTEDNLTAPVSSISYQLYNTSNCYFYKMRDVISKYEDGGWIEVMYKDYQGSTGSTTLDKAERELIAPKSVYDMQIIVDGENGHSNPLEQGVYRLVSSVQLKLWDGETIDHIQIYPTTHFTVTAPAE